MAGADMRSTSPDRCPADVVAQIAAAKAQKASAKATLPNLDAYALIKNPSSKQVEEAINLIAKAVANSLRGG